MGGHIGPKSRFLADFWPFLADFGAFWPVFQQIFAKKSSKMTSGLAEAMEVVETAFCEEFNRWSLENTVNTNTKASIRLKRCDKDKEDGKTSIVFEISKKQTFTLHCPLHYPKQVFKKLYSFKNFINKKENPSSNLFFN